jgi:hypothetical protein
MKLAAICLLVLLTVGRLPAATQARVLTKVDPLPVALSDDFQFRKTKLFELTVTPPKSKKSLSSALSTNNPNNPTAGIAEASLGFERTYRLHGAITLADRNQRYGNYMDFFWRVKRPANYLQDGRVTAWRCLLIENGRIVAENKSYLWE